METLEQITEIVQTIAILALLYFAWKTPGKARVPALLAGLFLLLRAVVIIYATMPPPGFIMMLVIDGVLTTVGVACLIWLLTRLE